MNTKRKSRQILLHMNGTGGGEPTKRTLTDLEEKLHSLISKIDLGDQGLMDSFDVVNTEIIVDVADIQVIAAEEIVVDNDINIQELQFHDGNADLKTDDLGKNVGQKFSQQKVGGVNKKLEFEAVDKAHINDECLENTTPKACESYSSAQTSKLETQKLKVGPLNNFAKSLDNFTAAYKERTAILEKQLKLEYFKVFGHLDGFNEF